MPPKKQLPTIVSEGPPPIEESPSPTTTQGTTRSIGMDGVIKEFGVNTTFTREQGTPQKRLHDLLDACKTIVANNGTIFKGKITTLNVQGLIDELEIAGREEMFKSAADKDLFCQYIDLFITSLRSTPDQITKNKILITVWSLVLVKSISDISQCGSLINDIPKLYPDNSIPNIPKNGVLSVLNSNKNVTFVSSDKICAALSSNILKLIDYPIQTLCSRKTGTTTQTMIIQKCEVSALSLVLSVVGDEEKSGRLIRDIIYYDSSDVNEEEVVNMVTSIHSYVTEYYTSILGNYFSDGNPNIKYIPQDIIQLEVDNLFISKNDRGSEKLCQLISQVSSIDNLKEKLLMLSYVLSSKDNVVVPRWTYHVSNDVFKYMFPLTQQTFEGTVLKNEISSEEIISATADAMYGHDFALSCITNLGREFLTAIGQADVYAIDENISYSKKEDLCISQTLQLNNFSTINQHGDKFSINFNSDSNYLVVDRKEMFYRISEIPWNITASPLIEQDIIASVDFVSGEPSISVVLSEQVNFLKQQNIRREQVLAFSILTQSEDLKTKLAAIKDNTSYKEYNGVTTLYDGAAPYGGLPIYKLDPYVSSMSITLKPSKKQGGDEENLILEINTKTTETAESLQIKWASDRIYTVDISYLKDNLILKVVLSEEQKGQLSNPPDTSPLYKFNLIWGTILNSKSNLTQQFRKEIYNEFRLVVAEIQNKIGQLNEKVAERSRRASIQQPISRFPRYDIFTDEIMESVEQIYGAVSENKNERLENFDVMMIEYIKILFMPEPPTTGNGEMEVVTTDTSVSMDTANREEQPNTGDGDTKMVATTNPLVSVETKETLLKILESAVRGVCSDDPDGLFKSLISYSQINQKINTGEKLSKIISDAEEKIKRDRSIANIKENFYEIYQRKRGPSKTTLEFSGETTGVTPEKSRETREQPRSDKSVKSAHAALYPSTSHWANNHSQMSGLTETPGDGNILDFGYAPDEVTRQGSQNTDYAGFDTDDSETELRPRKSESPPTSPRSNIIRRVSELLDSNGSASYGEHPRSEAKRSYNKDSDDENMNEGGSRKHHRTPHNSVTRRRNKKSSKRKTIKKRKMPKRKNNTRRNK